MAMKRADREAEMTRLLSEIEEKITSFNKENQEGSASEARKIQENITELCNEYTSHAKRVCYEDCLATESPMIEAIRLCEYNTIGVRINEVGDDKTPVMEKYEPTRKIQLDNFHKSVEGGIGADKNWYLMAQKLNYEMTLRVARKLKKPTAGIVLEYAIDEKAKAVAFKSKKPTEGKGLLASLNEVIVAMIGDGYEASEVDVEFLLEVYSKKNRKRRTVECAKINHFVDILKDICRGILYEEEYDMVYPVKKNNSK